MLQWVLDSLTGGLFQQIFALSGYRLRQGMIWQPITYMFLHGGAVHLLLNMLILFFLGPEVEHALGSRKFLALYLVSGVLGGVGWLLIEAYPLKMCVGASGAIFGVLGAFAALFPRRPITLLLFYVLPVTLEAWLMALALGVMELIYLLQPGAGGVANAAHLAGGVAGFFFVRGLEGDVPTFLKRLWEGRRRRDAHPARDRKLDELLDKIAREGLQSLTPEERRWLDEESRRRGRFRAD